MFHDEIQAHHYAHLETEHLEHRVDWVERGAVSHVRRDGNCAASWANAAISAIEGAKFIKDGHLHELSAQQIIDCDHQSYGCHGGLFTNAFDHAQHVPIMSEEDYPYIAASQHCLWEEGRGYA